MATQTKKQIIRNNLVVGNIGMYFAAYQLSRRSWNVMPTSRNARGIDLVAYDSGGRKFLGIQVKTLSRGRNAVPLGLHPHFLGDWWIIVTNVEDVSSFANTSSGDIVIAMIAMAVGLVGLKTLAPLCQVLPRATSVVEVGMLPQRQALARLGSADPFH